MPAATLSLIPLDMHAIIVEPSEKVLTDNKCDPRMHPRHPHDVPATPHVDLLSNGIPAESGTIDLSWLAGDMGWSTRQGLLRAKSGQEVISVAWLGKHGTTKLC